MKLTARHYYDFAHRAGAVGANLLRPEAWDALRIDVEDTPFSLPQNGEDWARKAVRQAHLAERARNVLALARRLGMAEIVSVGVGCAYLEHHIKRLAPELRLVCSDYSPQTVRRLQDLFPECDRIEQFDILVGPWQGGKGRLYLFHRVDTEFTDNQWQKVFADMHAADVRRIVFIPSQFLSLRQLLRERLGLIQTLIGRRPLTFAGWVRTRDALRGLWDRWFSSSSEEPFGDLTGFLLLQR